MPKWPSDAFELADNVIDLDRNWQASVRESQPGPPQRTDGYSIGLAEMSQADPHGGEMHPDGDEVLLVLTGSVTVEIEDEVPARRVTVAPGQAAVVPRGVWHRVHLNEPSRLVYITPGPGGDHRPR